MERALKNIIAWKLSKKTKVKAVPHGDVRHHLILPLPRDATLPMYLSISILSHSPLYLWLLKYMRLKKNF